MNRRTIKRQDRHQHARVFDRTLKWLARTLTATGQSISAARRLHRSYEELRAMSDLELQDIGITRADIPTIVAARFRRKRAGSNVLSIVPAQTAAFAGRKPTTRPQEQADVQSY